MAEDYAPKCERCAGSTRYDGRISMPTQMIYRCTVCGHQMWMQSSPPLAQPPDQPPAQQQQQVQPDKKNED